MNNQKENTKNGKDTKKQQDASTERSSADRKNEEALHRTPTANERVRSRAGDGLANEGTNVSYEEER